MKKFHVRDNLAQLRHIASVILVNAISKRNSNLISSKHRSELQARGMNHAKLSLADYFSKKKNGRQLQTQKFRLH